MPTQAQLKSCEKVISAALVGGVGGDNPHGCGITYNITREKWLVTDFLHGSFGNTDLIDFAIKTGGYTFKTAVALMEKCVGKEELRISSGYKATYDKKVTTISKNILEIFEYGLHPYLLNRGYTKDTVEHFGLGVATVGDLIDRITIPIVDETGELVAIQGRSFVGDEPKYLYIDGSGAQAKNTLYNLYNARNTIKEKGYVVVVEGAPSVWRAYQYGLRCCVATLSTSVTEKQLMLLKSLGVKIILAFDHDKDTQAGQMATLKLAKRLKESGFKLGCYSFNLGAIGLEGAIDDLAPLEVKKALKTSNRLF